MKEEFVKCCQKRLEEPAADNFYVYQCSFSMKNDCLCMWNYYTKGDDIQGYNLKFISSELRNNLLLEPNNACDGLPLILSGKVIYDEDEQIALIRNIIKKFVVFFKENVHIRSEQNLLLKMEYIVDKIMIQGIFFKSFHFKFENEYRLAINLFVDADGKYYAINNEREFTTKKNMTVPFTYIKFNPNVLKELTLSPTLEYESTSQKILSEYQNIFTNISINDIKKSNIPVRF